MEAVPDSELECRTSGLSVWLQSLQGKIYQHQKRANGERRMQPFLRLTMQDFDRDVLFCWGLICIRELAGFSHQSPQKPDLPPSCAFPPGPYSLPCRWWVQWALVDLWGRQDTGSRKSTLLINWLNSLICSLKNENPVIVYYPMPMETLQHFLKQPKMHLHACSNLCAHLWANAFSLAAKWRFQWGESCNTVLLWSSRNGTRRWWLSHFWVNCSFYQANISNNSGWSLQLSEILQTEK